MYRKIPRPLPELCPSAWANPTRPTHDTPNGYRESDRRKVFRSQGRDPRPAATSVLRCAQAADIVAAGGTGGLIELAAQSNLARRAAVVAGAAGERDQRGKSRIRSQIDAARIGTQHEVPALGRDRALASEEHDRRHSQ